MFFWAKDAMGRLVKIKEEKDDEVALSSCDFMAATQYKIVLELRAAFELQQKAEEGVKYGLVSSPQ